MGVIADTVGVLTHIPIDTFIELAGMNANSLRLSLLAGACSACRKVS